LHCGKTDFAINQQGAACKSCNHLYPSLGPTLWGYKQPKATIAQWQARAHMQIGVWQARETECKSNQDSLSAKRSQKFLQNLVEHKKSFQKILEDLIHDKVPQDAALAALGARVAANQSFVSYARNLPRDWAWDDAEPYEIVENGKMIAAALEKSQLLANRDKIKRILVLGAGACRFPLQIHELLQPEHTVCVDINPWLLWSGLRIASGKSMTFCEFPVAPTDESCHAVMHKVSRPKPAQNFYGLLADVRELPLADASFDLVVTPWLIDILQTPVLETFAAVNRVLRPGGYYFNFGSLAFPGANPKDWHDLNEITQLMGRSGLTLNYKDQVRLPYLCSPYSSQWRSEINTVWTAEKTADVAPLKAQEMHQGWASQDNVPVPPHGRFNELFSQANIYLAILSQIDGKRTLNDLAGFLEAKFGLPAAMGKNLIADFLQTAVERDTMSLWNQ
jgi:SAM-dependent methyltransferase